MEYLGLLGMVGKLPLKIARMGTWVGKEGNIDIIAQNEIRQNMVGFCNWQEPELTNGKCEALFLKHEAGKNRRGILFPLFRTGICTGGYRHGGAG